MTNQIDAFTKLISYQMRRANEKIMIHIEWFPKLLVDLPLSFKDVLTAQEVIF